MRLPLRTAAYWPGGRLVRALVVWLALGVGDAGPAFAGSAASRSPDAIGRLGAEIVAPWTALQRADGAFSDATFGGAFAVSRYSESMLGYQELAWGARLRNPALISSGFRALGYAVAHADAQQQAPSVFEELAVAGAFNLVRGSPLLAAAPEWAAQREQWAAWLQQVRPVGLTHRDGYGNHRLVEANAWLALRATGLSSPLPGTVLHRRDRIVPVVRALLRHATRHAHVRRVAGARAGILSDPPLDPLAYQGLSAGMYAHLLAALGRRAPARAWTTLAELVHGSWALAAPDGDLAYSGRSQEQAWALAFTVYAARLAARHIRGAAGPQDRALAARALRFLERRYGSLPAGLALTPAWSSADTSGARLGIDGYAGAPAFTGLTLLGLLWATDTPDSREPTGRLFADHDGSAVLDRGTGTFSVTRRGPVWFSVRQTRTPAADHRYRFDFMLAKTHTRAGWRDLIPVPPHAGADAPPGGLALATAAGWAEATATALHTAANGTVRAPGGFRTADGLMIRDRFTFAPDGRGVRLTVHVRRGQTLRYTTWLPPARALVTPHAVQIGHAILGLSQPAQFAVAGGYHSATYPELDIVTATTTAPRSGTLRITVQPLG